MSGDDELSPILIGITGRRFFNVSDPDQDQRSAAAIERRIAGCLEHLDVQFPDTPKILLTGAALGTDLLAARCALKRPSTWSRFEHPGACGILTLRPTAAASARPPAWRVAAILPFPREEFEKDFLLDRATWPSRAPAGIAADVDALRAWLDAWETRLDEYRTLLAECLDGHPDRVLVRTLPFLKRPDGGTVTVADLARGLPGPDAAPLRRAHYEQVGQWIAEASTVMIAAMDRADAPVSTVADGGTARVVACRRTGRPDPVGQAVAYRSGVLRHSWSPVLPPPGRHVWLVAGESGAAGTWPPCEVLEPLTPPFPSEEAHDAGEDERRGKALAASVAVANRFSRVHRHARWFAARGRAEARLGARSRWAALPRAALTAWIWWRGPPTGSAPAPDLTTCAPAEAIKRVRDRLGQGQRRSKALSDGAFKGMAALFLVSLATFEVFAKFAPGLSIVLASYALCTALSGGVIALARWRVWQAAAEDARSVSEMLRLQRAWWAAGLPDRVDRGHLQGVAEDLAQVRDAGTTLLAWIWLRSGWASDTPEPGEGGARAGWALVRGTARAARSEVHLGAPPKDWIGEQLRYFRLQAEKREDKVHLAETGSWFLFIAAWWLAVIVALWTAAPGVKHLFEDAGSATRSAACALAFLPWLAAALLSLWLRLRKRNLARSFMRSPFRRALEAILWPLPAAALLATAAMAAGPDLAHLFPNVHDAATAGKYAALVSVALLIGGTGAWRFLAEKFGHEAEALEFRDAYRRFWMAERALAEIVDADGLPFDETSAREVVRALGRRALVENEAWLKTRRERPLTPLAG